MARARKPSRVVSPLSRKVTARTGKASGSIRRSSKDPSRGLHDLLRQMQSDFPLQFRFMSDPDGIATRYVLTPRQRRSVLRRDSALYQNILSGGAAARRVALVEEEPDPDPEPDPE